MGVGVEFVGPVTMQRGRNMRSRYDRDNSELPSPGIPASRDEAPSSGSVHSFGRRIGEGTQASVSEGRMFADSEPKNTSVPKAKAQEWQFRKQQKRKESATPGLHVNGGGFERFGTPRTVGETTTRNRAGGSFTYTEVPSTSEVHSSSKRPQVEVPKTAKVDEHISTASTETQGQPNIHIKTPNGSGSSSQAKSPRLDIGGEHAMDSNMSSHKSHTFEAAEDVGGDKKSNPELEKVRMDYENRFHEMRSDYENRFREMQIGHRREIEGLHSALSGLQSKIDEGMRFAQESNTAQAKAKEERRAEKLATKQARQATKAKQKKEEEAKRAGELAHIKKRIDFLYSHAKVQHSNFKEHDDFYRSKFAELNKQRESDLAAKQQRQAAKAEQKKEEEARRAKELADFKSGIEKDYQAKFAELNKQREADLAAKKKRQAAKEMVEGNWFTKLQRRATKAKQKKEEAMAQERRFKGLEDEIQRNRTDIQKFTSDFKPQEPSISVGDFQHAQQQWQQQSQLNDNELRKLRNDVANLRLYMKGIEEGWYTALRKQGSDFTGKILETQSTFGESIRDVQSRIDRMFHRR